MSKLILSNADVMKLAEKAAKRIERPVASSFVTFYAIPRGGIPAAYAIAAAVNRDRGFLVRFVDTPDKADYIVDDIFETGGTMAREIERARDASPRPIILVDKREAEFNGKWIVFPWEATAEKGVEDHIIRLMQFCGEDTSREGLRETPARVAKAWQFWTKGYDEDPASILKVFEDGAENVDEMVVVRDIPVYSHCEHHMAAIFGRATIAYIPNGKIVGLSKLNRLVDCFGRRLQVQERLTTQIADALMTHLEPKGCGVIINARHMCMESRGVCQQGHSTITSALRGVFKEGTQRAEFLALSR